VTPRGPGRRLRPWRPVPPASHHDPRTRPIGVFDSGVGGLTVLHELLVALPHEDFLYLGDTARFPYGERSPEELQALAVDVADTLLARRAKLVVVACNTAASVALPALRRRMMETTLGVDVLGVIRPEALQAVAATRSGRIGLLATPRTVASGAYADAVAAVDPHVSLTSVPCPDLAPIIQGGFPFDERVVETVRGYCAPLKAAAVDTVILGCTHYPLVRPVLQRTLGRDVEIVTSGEAIAAEVERELAGAGLAAPAHRRGRYSFLASGDPGEFRRLGTRFLQLPIARVGHVRVSRPGAPSEPAGAGAAA